MYVKIEDSYTDLVTCFFEECERTFRFLELEHGFVYLSGLVSHHNGREIITPYQNQKIDDIFQLTTRYERDNIVIEIKYGDDDFSVEPYLYYNFIQRLGWDDVLRVTKKRNNQDSVRRNVLRVHDIKSTIENMSALMKENAASLVSPTNAIIRKAAALREKHIEETLRSRAKDQVKQATKTAAKAYRTKDYKLVIEVLTPYEFTLKRSDLKKLNQARKKFLSQN